MDPIKDLFQTYNKFKPGYYLDEDDFTNQLSKDPKGVFETAPKGYFLDYEDFENIAGLKKKIGGVPNAIISGPISPLSLPSHETIAGLDAESLIKKNNEQQSQIINSNDIYSPGLNMSKMYESKQSRLNKTASIVKDFTRGVPLAVADVKYLKEAAPTAFNDVIRTIKANNNTVANSDNIDDIVGVNNENNAQLFYNQIKPLYEKSLYESGALLMKSGFYNIKDIRNDSLVKKYISQIDLNLKNETDQLEKKYPLSRQFLAEDYSESTRANPEEYQKEFDAIQQKYGKLRSSIGELKAYDLAQKLPYADADPFKIGMEYLKYTDPIKYQNRIKAGAETVGDNAIAKKGNEIRIAANTDPLKLKEILKDNDFIDERFTMEREQDVLHRLAAEHYNKSNKFWYNPPTIKELDNYKNQLPAKEKTLYETTIRPRLLSEGVESDQGVFSFAKSVLGYSPEIPVSGGLNSLIGGVYGVAESSGKFVAGAFGQRSESDKAQELLNNPMLAKTQGVGQSSEAIARINTINEKERVGKLSLDELNEREDLKSYTNIVGSGEKWWNSSMALAGQVVGQAVLARGLGGALVGGASKLGILASEGASVVAGGVSTGVLSAEAINATAASAIGFASSFDDASKQGMELGLYGAKNTLFSTVVGVANYKTEAIFKDTKVLDVFKKEIAGQILSVVEKLGVEGISRELFQKGINGAIKNAVKYTLLTEKEAAKEVVEETATTAITQAAIAALAPDQFSMSNAANDIGQTISTTFLDGQIVAGFAGIGEYRANVIGIPTLSRLGIDKQFTDNVINAIDAQQKNGVYTIEEAAEKKRILQNIVATNSISLPEVKKIAPTLGRNALQKYGVSLAYEKTLKEKMDATTDDAIKEVYKKKIEEGVDLRKAILAKQVFIDDKFNVYATQESNISEGLPEDRIVQPTRTEAGQPEAGQGEGTGGQGAQQEANAGDSTVSGQAEVVQPTTTEEVIADEGSKEEVIRVQDALNGDNIFVRDGQRGTVKLDGQTVVFETEDKIIELGNVDELQDSTLNNFGISKEQELDITLNDDNSITYNGKTYLNNYSNPELAFSRDKDGNYSVTLETENGKKRTFRGQQAEQIVYQSRLKNFEQNATREQIDEANRLADESIGAEEKVREASTKRKGKSVRKATETKPTTVVSKAKPASTQTVQLAAPIIETQTAQAEPTESKQQVGEEAQQPTTTGTVNSNADVKVQAQIKAQFPFVTDADFVQEAYTPQEDEDDRNALPDSGIPTEQDLKDLLEKGEYAILSGQNPSKTALSKSANQQLNEKAVEWLKARGLNPIAVFGKYGNSERSFLVPKMTQQQAVEFAKEFQQESVAHNTGLVYPNGTIEKRLPGVSTSNYFDKKDDNYTSVNVGGKAIDFKLNFDFGNRVEIKSVAQKAKEFLVGTKEELKKNLDNLQKALRATGIKVLTPATSAEYDAIIKNRNGQENTEGIFFDSSGEIVLNMEKLEGSEFRDRVIWHEGSHPVLNILRNTNPKLYQRVLDGLNQLAKTNPDVAESLDYAEQYRDRTEGSDAVKQATVNDEFVTETTAMMADGTIDLDEIPDTVLQKVFDFLNEAAKLLGIKGRLYVNDKVAAKKIMKEIANALTKGKNVASVVGKKNVLKFNGNLKDFQASANKRFDESGIQLTEKDSKTISQEVIDKTVKGKPIETWVQLGMKNGVEVVKYTGEINQDNVRSNAPESYNTIAAKLSLYNTFGIDPVKELSIVLEKASKESKIKLLGKNKVELDKIKTKLSEKLRSIKKAKITQKYTEELKTQEIENTISSIDIVSKMSKTRDIEGQLKILLSIPIRGLKDSLYNKLFYGLNEKLNKDPKQKLLENSDVIYRKAKDVIKSNLRSVYNSVSPIIRDISKLWYDGANLIAQDMGKKYNISNEQAAAIIATQSPQKPWFDNLHIAEVIMDLMHNKKDEVFTDELYNYFVKKSKKYPEQIKYSPELKKSVGKKLSELSNKDAGIFIRAFFDLKLERRAPKRIPTGTNVNVLQKGRSSFGGYDTIEKAVSIYRNGSIANISEQLGDANKVRNFYMNIANPADKRSVTMDTHAMAIALMMPLASDDYEVNFDPATFAFYADAYRELAEELGIGARELQSITWEAARAIFPKEEKAKAGYKEKISKIWDQYTDGSKTLEETQAEIFNQAQDPNITEWVEYINELKDEKGRKNVSGSITRLEGNNNTSELGNISGTNIGVPVSGRGVAKINKKSKVGQASVKRRLTENKTAKTQTFFSNVVKGENDKYKPKKDWQPLMKLREKDNAFNRLYSNFKGNFDTHIATSIPGFRDVQVKKGVAMASLLPEGGLIYDIGGSEGGLIKAITKMSGGKIKSINVDVNEDMQKAFTQKPVAGSKFVNEAFLEPYEENGKVYPAHVPEQKADIVHESMVFQFISPEREQFIDEIADNYITEDGVVILEEKVQADSDAVFAANEKFKDENFKLDYYDASQLDAKREEVLTGMKENQTQDGDLINALQSRFKFVSRYWDSGNFKGYVASNNEAKVNKFMKEIGDTDTKFTTKPTGPVRGQASIGRQVKVESPELLDIKNNYVADNNITTPQVENNKKFTPEDIDRIADMHENAIDDRKSPEVLKTYNAFMDETKKQYELLVEQGYKIEPWLKEGEPYGVDSSAVREDVNNNKHLFYLRSKSATGVGETDMSGEDYILFKETGIKINGDNVLYNDLFRAVHDILGHCMYKNSFSTQGEFQAYLTHSNMFSEDAQSALFLETVSYNAYYSKNKEYAPRKMYVVPKEEIASARGTSGQASISRIKTNKNYKLAAFVMRMKQEGASNAEIATAIASISPLMTPSQRAASTGGLSPANAPTNPTMSQQQIVDLVNDPEKFIKDSFPGLSDDVYNNIIERAKVENIYRGLPPTSSVALAGFQVPNDVIDAAIRNRKNKAKAFAESVKNFKDRWLNPNRGLPDWVLGVRDMAKGTKDVEIARANKLMQQIKSTASKIGFTDWDAFELALKAVNQLAPVQPTSTYNISPQVLPQALQNIPSQMVQYAIAMRAQVDRLTKDLIGNGYITPMQAVSIEKNIGEYFNRAYKMYTEKNYKPSEEHYKAAVKYFAEIMKERLFADNPNMPVSELMDEAARLGKQKVDDILSKEKNPYFNTGSSDSRNTGILKERKDIPEVLRKLMGEYTDPGTIFVVTVAKQASLKSQSEYLYNLRKLGLGTLFYEENDKKRPDGYSVKIASEGTDAKNPLGGLWTTPEIAKILEAQDPTLNAITNGYMKAVGAVKWGKTVGSVVTQFKNFESNLGFAVMNGLLLSNNKESFGGAAKYYKMQFGKEDIDSITEKCMQLGLVGQSIGARELKDMLGSGDLHDIALGKVFGVKNKFLKELGNKVNPIPIANKLYRLGDDFWKVYAYLNERQSLSDARYGQKYEDLTPSEQKKIDIESSERVKNTWPTYDRVVDAIKIISKSIPILGNFVSFQAESIRCLNNTVKMAISDMKDPELRILGIKRLIGISTYVTMRTGLTYWAAQSAGIAYSGILSAFEDDEEEQKRKRAFKHAMAFFTKPDDLLILKTDDPAKYIVYSLSTLDPYGIIPNTLNAFTNGSNKTEPGFTAGIVELFSTFLEPEMTFQTANSIANNRNLDTGKPIWGANDDPSTSVAKAAEFIFKRIEPSTLSTMKRLYNNENKWAELAAFAGARPMTVDFNESFKYKLSEMQTQMIEVANEYNSIKYNTKKTPEEIDVAEKEAEQKKSRIIAKYNQIYNDYLTAGASKEFMDNLVNQSRAVKSTGFDKQTKNAIKTGIFTPDYLFK